MADPWPPGGRVACAQAAKGDGGGTGMASGRARVPGDAGWRVPGDAGQAALGGVRGGGKSTGAIVTASNRSAPLARTVSAALTAQLRRVVPGGW